jgi:hypothetical protein
MWNKAVDTNFGAGNALQRGRVTTALFAYLDGVMFIDATHHHVFASNSVPVSTYLVVRRPVVIAVKSGKMALLKMRLHKQQVYHQ